MRPWFLFGTKPLCQICLVHGGQALVVPETDVLLGEGHTGIELQVFVLLTDPIAHFFWKDVNKHLS